MNRLTLESFKQLTQQEQLVAIYATLLDAPAAPSLLPAYERPEILPGHPDFKIGVRLADGSIWAQSKPIPGRDTGGPYKQQHGYISERKHPELWALARKVLGPDFGPRFEDPWKADPFQIYAGNPAVLLRQGYAMPGEGRETTKNPEDATEINFMMFNYTLQPTGISVPQ